MAMDLELAREETSRNVAQQNMIFIKYMEQTNGFKETSSNKSTTLVDNCIKNKKGQGPFLRQSF